MKNPKASAEAVAQAAADPQYVENIFTDGMLVDLDISFWSAKYRNTPSDLNVDPATLPEFVVGLGTKRLITKEQVMAWKRIAQRAYSVLEKYSYSFPVGAGRFVPLSALPKIDAELGECQQEFTRVVQEFLANYDTLRAEMLEKYADRRDSLEGLYPSRTELERRFSFTWKPYAISLPKSLKTKALDRQKQNAYAERLHQEVNGFVTDAVSVLRAKVVEVCAEVAESVRKRDIISEPSLNRVRNLIESFRALNFAGDRRIEDALAALKAETLNGRTAAEFRDNEAMRQGLVNNLSAVAQAARDISDINTVAGTYRRKIQL